MMRIFIAGTFIVMCALTAYLALRSSGSGLNDSQYQVSEAKRMSIESENSVRPAYFEDMKWNPSVEVRAPAASQGK